MPDEPVQSDPRDEEATSADEPGDEPSADDCAAGDAGDSATWQPQRGPLTRIFAWVILAMILLGSLVMLWTAIRR